MWPVATGLDNIDLRIYFGVFVDLIFFLGRGSKLLFRQQ